MPASAATGSSVAAPGPCRATSVTISAWAASSAPLATIHPASGRGWRRHVTTAAQTAPVMKMPLTSPSPSDANVLSAGDAGCPCDWVAQPRRPPNDTPAVT